jgi:hypothetical protein
VSVSPLTNRVASAVRGHFPSTRCFRCLSLQLGLTEKQVRDAAQVLIIRDESKIRRLACDMCSRISDTLVRPRHPVDISVENLGTIFLPRRRTSAPRSGSTMCAPCASRRHIRLVAGATVSPEGRRWRAAQVARRLVM